MRAYYNDNDRHAAAWLRELIKAGLITEGDVDDRSIKDVRASDLKGYGRCHFFAGIGGWDYALRLAGWPSDRYVWTGSCPCQPLSGAGQRKGEQDKRHLWPEFHRLISKCRPATVFGEQVASNDGREWFAGVRADLEALEYAVGGADLCAAGEGAPHIRQRLFWVANCDSRGKCWRPGQETGTPSEGEGEMGVEDWQRLRIFSGRDSGMGDSCEQGWTVGMGQFGNDGAPVGQATRKAPEQTSDYWSDSVLIPCGDGKARRIEPGLSPLVDGLPGRVGLLRGYGNSIVPEVAKKFIRAAMLALSEATIGKEGR